MEKEISDKNLLNKEYKGAKGFFLSDVAINLFILYILTQSWLFYLILESNIPQIAILTFVSSLLILKNFKDGYFIITRIDVFWLIAIVVILMYISYFGILENDVLLFTYVFGLIFLLLSKVDISRYEKPINTIKLIAIFYALMTMFHYFFTDLYHSMVFPFVSSSVEQRMVELVRLGYYSGLGFAQPAMAAGPMIMGIGAILSSVEFKRNNQNVLDYLALFILLIGLIMAGKRSILIWGIIASLLTYYSASSMKNKTKRILNLTSGLFVVLLFIIGLSNYDSLPFLERITRTINGIIEGEDVTSGRIVLYERAWELFKENPIFGIGWGQFIQVTSGQLLSRDLSVHNVYLQLLTETGLVGFILIIVPLIFVYYSTFKIMKAITISSKLNNTLWKKGVIFSFYYQTFFLLYCITENPFYNIFYMLMYFFSISIVNSFVVYKSYLGRKANIIA